jgi:hypothetical protein
VAHIWKWARLLAERAVKGAWPLHELGCLPPRPCLAPAHRMAKAWRERVAPLMREHLAQRVDSVVTYSLIFQETALANLLEVCGLARRGLVGKATRSCRMATG